MLGSSTSLGVLYSRDAGADLWKRTLTWSALIMALCVSLALQVQGERLPIYFLLNQDMPVIILMACLFLLWRSPAVEKSKMSCGMPALSTPVVLLWAASIVVICGAGHQIVMVGHALSRDEQMAWFTAETIAEGRLYALIGEPWLSVRSALNTTFMVEGGPANIWMPVYLGGNGALHALVGLVLPPFLTNPLLNGIGLVATWGVARQLWPQREDLHGVPVLLFALSTQQLASGMTSYAMTGHLALNMIWLWLFLRDRPWSHGAAVAVGIVATGLHQLPFHPLFVAPMLVLLLLRRRWPLFAFYLFAYGLIGVFWISYLKIPFFAPPEGADAGQGAARVVSIANSAFAFSYANIEMLAANMIRFFAWEHILLLPLMLVGARTAWRTRNPIQLALLGTFLIAVAVRLVLRAYQGHGWGYRYLHGLIGVACLTATYGWAELRTRNLIGWPQLRAASLLTLAVPLPFLLYQTHAMVRASAAISKRIDRQQVTAVIVDDRAAPFAKDIVINRPELNNHPVRLLASRLSPADVEKLCMQMSMAEVSAADLSPLARQFGVEGESTKSSASFSNTAPRGCLLPLRP